MAMTFDTLIGSKSTDGSIKSWLNYGLVDSEGVLTEAVAMICTRLRVREMRASATLSFVAGDYFKALPDGFLDPRSFLDVTNGQRIVFYDEEALEVMRSWTADVLDDGDPSAYAIFDELLQLDCTTTTAWTGRMLYWKQPTALSTDNETNWLTTRYPHVLRMACVATAARFNDDAARFEREQRLLFNEISEVNIMDDLSRRGQENPVIDYDN